MTWRGVSEDLRYFHYTTYLPGYRGNVTHTLDIQRMEITTTTCTHQSNFEVTGKFSEEKPCPSEMFQSLLRLEKEVLFEAEGRRTWGVTEYPSRALQGGSPSGVIKFLMSWLSIDDIPEHPSRVMLLMPEDRNERAEVFARDLLKTLVQKYTDLKWYRFPGIQIPSEYFGPDPVVKEDSGARVALLMEP